MLLERGLGVGVGGGELSNFSQPASGHWYFSLKDRDAQLRCAMFRLQERVRRLHPAAGQQVLLRGRISLYEPRGEYQLIVEHLEEAGVGALQREFERLKAKLAAEGLFALERKRSLPRFPRRIGVVTSPTGAALRDILHILARRFPPAAVLIYPTPVQGAAAVPALVAALRAGLGARRVRRADPGARRRLAGGPVGVQRRARRARHPRLRDAGGLRRRPRDRLHHCRLRRRCARARRPPARPSWSCPTAAACLEALARTAQRLSGCMRRELRTSGTRLEACGRRLRQAHPGVRLLQQVQRLDDLELRLAGAARSHAARCGTSLRRGAGAAAPPFAAARTRGLACAQPGPAGTPQPRRTAAAGTHRASPGPGAARTRCGEPAGDPQPRLRHRHGQRRCPAHGCGRGSGQAPRSRRGLRTGC